jgi:hypothetical protein
METSEAAKIASRESCCHKDVFTCRRGVRPATVADGVRFGRAVKPRHLMGLPALGERQNASRATDRPRPPAEKAFHPSGPTVSDRHRTGARGSGNHRIFAPRKPDRIDQKERAGAGMSGIAAAYGGDALRVREHLRPGTRTPEVPRRALRRARRPCHTQVRSRLCPQAVGVASELREADSRASATAARDYRNRLCCRGIRSASSHP